jgi:sarcosine oxidase subunit gamma
VVIRERPFVGKLSLKGRLADAAFVAGAETTLAAPLPTRPGHAADGRCRILALAPDEWLLVGEMPEIERLGSELEARLAALHASVVDLGSATTIIEIEGSNAASLIAKGCSVDLGSGTARAERCFQTRLARLPVLIDAPFPGTRLLRVFIPRSLARSLWDWLSDAALEFRLAPPSR